MTTAGNGGGDSVLPTGPDRTTGEARSISHDLRASVRQIKSFTQLLELHVAESADGETREYLGILNAAADQLWERVKDVDRILLAKERQPPRTE